MMKSVLFALALTVATPAMAQTVAPTADAAKLDVATRIAGTMFPDGTYRKMMSGTFDQIMTSAFDSMGDLPMRDIAIAAGMKEEDVPKTEPGAMKEVMAILDPAYRQRMDLGMKAMMGSMVDLFEKFEPAMRAGLAEAYAKRFDAGQLSELERFFITPTGKLYAEQSMLVYSDPAVMKQMTAMMPDMMKQMPKMIGAMTDATKDLPKARKYADLTKDERARVAQLLGLDPKLMK
jgi:hypothetical protein